MQHADSRFSKPVTDEVFEARKIGIPKKTLEDTQYCVRIWEAWRKNRNDQGYSIPTLVEMRPLNIAYWMTRFKKN